MATARKLPSDSWRCQVFSHYEPVTDSHGKHVLDSKTGKQKLKRVYVSFTSDDTSNKGKRTAERMALEWVEQKENRNKPSNLTYGEALDKYIEQRSAILSPSTIREYTRSRRVDFQQLVDIPISKLTQEQIQQAVNDASVSHSPKSVRNMHGLLSAVLGAYRPDFALKTVLPKKVRPKIYVPSDSEIQRILQFVEGDVMEIPILLAAFGPMRRSEICALDSRNISGNVIHVEFAMVLNSNNDWVTKRPKSYAGDRYIEFPNYVIDKLKCMEGRIVNLNPSQVTDRFRDILLRCGIKHFRFHDLRHYCASIQHAIGVPDVYIMQRGGWGNDGVLKNIYRHVLEEKEREMNDKANEYFSNLCNTKCNTK